MRPAAFLGVVKYGAYEYPRCFAAAGAGWPLYTAPNLSAPPGQALTQSPQRTHSALLGVWDGSISALQACVHKAGGKVLSDEAESFTVELTDSESQINKFIAEAGNLGEVLEVVRSGALAMLRGATTLRA